MAKNPHPRVTIDGSSLVAPDSDNYEYEVNGVYMTMQLSRVGVALVDSLPRQLFIRPYTGTDPNAVAKPVDRLAAEEAGHRSYRCDNAAPRLDAAGNPLLGTGVGTDSIIKFTPSQFLTSGMADARKKKLPPGARRDEVLFHEMVHSLRQMVGMMNCTTGYPGFDTKEEVWAIMTTNVYCSAWRRPLRRDHDGFSTMTDDEIAGFYKKFEVMIGYMCVDLPTFTRNVAQIDYIKFNPFREYYRLHR